MTRTWIRGCGSWWRSLSGAAEDRNDVTADAERLTLAWRSPAEDRNAKGDAVALQDLKSGGRPPGRPRIATTGASTTASHRWQVAVALRGGRGGGV
ncbi:hypothetical protein [Streptomyces brasiliensis]|uniref:hypothetical protein n=1 Tax=Streptomyces brasiliensis TaxID=1954 RepID=UPI0040330F7B